MNNENTDVIESENTEMFEDEVENQLDEESEAESDDESDETHDDEEEESETSEEVEDEKPKKSNGFKKRIDKLKKREAKAKEEADYWRREALKGKSQQEEPKKESKPDLSSKPNPNDFDTQVEYIDALTDWKIDQRESAKAEKQRKEAIDQKKSTVAEAWQNKVQDFAAKTPDFQDIMDEVDDDIVLGEDLQDAIIDSDLGPQILYHLAKNPEEAESIINLNGIKAYKAIGKLEAKLSSAPEKTKIKKTTKAPKPLNQSKGTKQGTKSPSEMSFSEYEAWRKQQAS